MIDTLVANASPLILLAKANHLALLHTLASQVLVPAEVVAEIQRGPLSDPARRALEQGWGRAMPAAVLEPQVLEWSLGVGESAVISVALQCTGAWALLDDAEARACARTLGIRVIGTLGIVLRAKRHGLVPLAGPVVRALLEGGLYLDPDFLRAALRTHANEEWLDES